jgi:TatD DNase family protein
VNDRSALPPPPEPLPSPVVDNHTHLDHARRSTHRGGGLSVEDAVAAAAAVGVPRVVQIGCDLEAAAWTVELLDTPVAAGAIVGGVALHPTEAAKLGAGVDAAMSRIEGLAQHPRVRVVGETGLDHYWVPADEVRGRAAQEASFRRHIGLAKRLGKVLQIHDRDAHADVLRILTEEGAPERTVFHCFSGDAEMARFCAEHGWYLSFAGTLTFKNAVALRDALGAVPLDRVLVETDAPYLTPAPFRGRPNASYLVPLTVRCMADVLGRELDDVCLRLNATSEELYGPW